jgi:histidinol dehydrogenase
MLKIFKFNQNNSLKKLEIFLDKRKSIQKGKSSIVKKIINNVKKSGDKAVLNYEKKFSKVKTKSKKIYFSNKELNTRH